MRISDWSSDVCSSDLLTIYWGVGTVRSMGSESDSLLGLLAQEYGSPPSHRTMSARTRVTVAALNSDPRAPHAGKLTMKVFLSTAPRRITARRSSILIWVPVSSSSATKIRSTTLAYWHRVRRSEEHT